jgi:hypothetical protein
LVQIIKPFPVRQVYSLLPRLASKVADTDFRVGRITDHSAVIQWHSGRDLLQLPPALHHLYRKEGCEYCQGILSVIPKVHSGLPMASIQELHCQLRGDPYCEWEFSWQKQGRGGLSAGTLAGRPAGKGEAPALFDESLVAYPAPHPASETDLPPLPPVMQGRPFGVSESGKPIKHVRGTLVRGSVEQMQDFLAQRLAAELPAGLSAEEKQARLAEARNAALAQLVERLNAAIAEPAYRISASYLLEEANVYSEEFLMFTDALAAQICGDRDFAFHRGMRSIPASVVTLARPFSVRQVYNLLPRFTAMVTNDDVRSISTTSNSAVIQAHAAKMLGELPPAMQRRFIHAVCQSYQGAFMMVPRALLGLPLAHVKETRCALHGDAYCEWEFSWQTKESGVSRLAWLAGPAVLLVLLGYGLLSEASWPIMAWLGALAPAVIGWLAVAARNTALARDRAERMVLDQREQAEAQYDRLQAAHGDVQVSNVALRQKVSELTALHEIGLAVSALNEEC